MQVVGGPVVVVGNSIGGFVAASMAADYPDLASGLVLINSAGPIKAGYDPSQPDPPRSPPPALLASAISFALLFYLERTIGSTLKWLYPTNPGNADEWLCGEIYRWGARGGGGGLGVAAAALCRAQLQPPLVAAYAAATPAPTEALAYFIAPTPTRHRPPPPRRAACDPGSFEVFRSVFFLPPPRPLNHLVAGLFGKPTRVLQGRLDPLNDAAARAEQLGSLCANVDVVLLDAGHCPHDEQPGLVNEGILDFVRTRVAAGVAAGAAAGAVSA
jgi:pimeloyl-ACP methyl ester carboxylesterase